MNKWDKVYTMSALKNLNQKEVIENMMEVDTDTLERVHMKGFSNMIET